MLSRRITNTFSTPMPFLCLFIALMLCDCDKSPGTDGGEDECRLAGHYSAGKEGSSLPCCAGLTEVFQKNAVYSDDNKACVDLPHREYACVEGECGDGVCEVGEDKPCGCALDCPDAVWEETVDTSGSSGTSTTN